MATKKNAAGKGKKKKGHHAPTHDHGDVDTSRNVHGEAYELWDFLPAFVHPPGVHGVPQDYEATDEDLIESICNGDDDSQPVEQYDGTLGVTQQFVADHERPVGQIQWNDNLGSIYTDPGNVSGIRWCTGTLISCDLFLTAGHCFDQSGGGWTRPKTNGTTNTIPVEEIATNMHVNFNYQVDPAGNLRPVDDYAVTQLVEYRLGGVDFAVIRLAGNPGGKYGFTRISPTDANIGDMLCIIQHPAGVPKRIEAGSLTDFHDNRLGYNDIDTLAGSSGSGVLAPNGRIVGVHTNGGCNVPIPGHNHGRRISSIIAASPTVSNLATTKQKFMDDGCPTKFKFRDDVKPPWGDLKYKFTDDAVFKNPRSDVPKGIGDVKAFGYDVRPWVRRPSIFGGFARRGRFRGARSPFILSTPHHSEAFTDQGPGSAGDAEAYLAEITEAMEAMGQNMAELQEAYEQILAQLEGSEIDPGSGGS